MHMQDSAAGGPMHMQRSTAGVPMHMHRDAGSGAEKMIRLAVLADVEHGETRQPEQRQCTHGEYADQVHWSGTSQQRGDRSARSKPGTRAVNIVDPPRSSDDPPPARSGRVVGLQPGGRWMEISLVRPRVAGEDFS